MEFVITIDKYHLLRKLIDFRLKQLNEFQVLHYERKGVIKCSTMLTYQSYLLCFRMVNEATLLNGSNDNLPTMDIKKFMLQTSILYLEMVLNILLIFNKFVACVLQDPVIEICIQIFRLFLNNQS
jgi:hypothetical protein